MKIKSIYIDGIRHFKDFYLEFNDRLNLLVGPNGSGKTTILEIISKINIHDYDDLRYLDENSKQFFVYVYLHGALDSDFYSQLDKETFYKIDTNKLSVELDNLDKLSTSLKDFFKNTNKYYINGNENTKKYSFTDKREVMFLICIEYNVSKDRHFPEVNFLIIQNNQLIYFPYLSTSKTFPYMPKIQTHNFHQVVNDLNKHMHGIPKMQRLLVQQQKEQSRLYNKELINKQDTIAFQSETPTTNINVIDKASSRFINQLSSGDQQLKQLETLVLAKQRLRPNIALLDEPELHLNPGNYPKLLEIIHQLSENSTQLIIATHSSYLAQHLSPALKLINLKNSKPVFKSLDKFYKPTPQGKHILKKRYHYLITQLLFVNGVVLFEEETARYFFEESFRVIWTTQNYSISKNVGYFSVQGKDDYQKVIEICKHFKIPYVIVTDLDAISKSKSYNQFFVGLNNKTITTDKKNLEELITNYQTTDKSKCVFKKAFQLLKEYNIWILQKGSLEDYVSEKYKYKKVKMYTLQEFVPETEKDIQDAVVNESAFKEIKQMVEFVYNTLYAQTTR